MLCLLFLLYTVIPVCAFTGQSHSSYKQAEYDKQIAKTRILSPVGHNTWKNFGKIGLLACGRGNILIILLTKDSKNDFENKSKAISNVFFKVQIKNNFKKAIYRRNTKKPPTFDERQRFLYIIYVEQKDRP